MESEIRTEHLSSQIGHRPKGDNVPGNFYLSPVDGPKSNVWYKMVPIGRNTLAKQI